MVLLGALSAFGPLSSDMYLPAMPSLSRSLHASSSLVQLSLSLCFLGLGIGQLFAGAISDAIGRRRPLLLGLVAYIAASAVCAVVPSIIPLLLMRFIQGLAGAFGIAIARAVIRDTSGGRRRPRVRDRDGRRRPRADRGARHRRDRAPLHRLAGDLRGADGGRRDRARRRGGEDPESLAPGQRNADGIAGVGETVRVLTGDRRYLGHILCSGLACGTLISYISGSPFVLERIHGLTPQEFSLVFAGNGGGLMLARQIASTRLRTTSPDALLNAALSLQAAGAFGVLATVALHLGLIPLLLSFFLAASTFGAIVPIATALAMEDHPERAGSASGMLGFVQFAMEPPSDRSSESPARSTPCRSRS